MALDQQDIKDARDASGRDARHDADEQPRMSFGEHLEDLRYRVVMALVGIAVAAVGALFFGREIVGWLVRPLALVLASAGLPPQAHYFSPMAGFTVYLKVSIVAGLVVASPWVIYQLWRFVSGGLYRHERRAVYIVAPFSATMSLLGVAFMYYIMLPISLAFLIFFASNYPAPDLDGLEREGVVARLTGLAARMGGGAGGDDAPVAPDQRVGEADVAAATFTLVPILDADPAAPEPGQIWMKLPERELRVYFDGQVLRYSPQQTRSMLASVMGIHEYIGFVVMITLGIVIAFQLPVVMLVLGSTGIVDPAVLARYRKHCIFGCFATAAIFTPAEPISMIILAAPMWLLFEFGLLLMRRVYRRTDADQASQP